MSTEWSVEREHVLHQWHSHAELMGVLHDRAAQYFSQRARWFGLPILVLGAFTTSSLFAVISQSETSSALRFTVAITSFVVTALNAADRFLGYNRQRDEHLRSKLQYSGLAIDLSELLACPVAERADARQTVSALAKRMTQMNDVAPLLPESLLDTYSRQVEQEVKRMIDLRPAVNRSLEKVTVEAKEEMENVSMPPQVRVIHGALDQL